MENQHRKISGYRELSQEEIDLMNEIKAHGPALAATLAKLDAHLQRQALAAQADGMDAERQRLADAEPGRWRSIGKTELQQGLMAITRAVAQPTFL